MERLSLIKITEKIFRLIVKPNQTETRILKYDDARKAYRMIVAAPPEDNKANKEIILFFKKKLKKNVAILSGMSSREKLIKVL